MVEHVTAEGPCGGSGHAIGVFLHRLAGENRHRPVPECFEG